MTELVIIQNLSAVTSSLVVAESFGKEHKHVLESIKNLTVENSAVKNLFFESTYKNERGREYPLYYMNRDGFTLLAMGFNGSEALKFKLKYIEAFNNMEKQLIQPTTLPTTYKEALVALLGEVEKNEVLVLEVQTLQPKAQYTEEVLLSGDALTITQIAKDLGMTGQELNDKLHELKVQYKQGKVWHLYEKYDGLGYTKAHTYNVEGRTPTLTKWTQKGRKFIIDLLKETEK